MTGLKDPATFAPAFDPAERGLGVLVPVVAGHGGVGASGVALALADALNDRGLRVLLIDGSEPARSGLADVWTQQLRSDPPGRAGAVVTTARRGEIVGRYARGMGSAARPWSYPYLDEWMQPVLLEVYGQFDATVVDVGWDPWFAFANLGSGPMAWLSARPESTFAVLVAKPTKPSMRLTTGTASRWLRVISHGEIAVPPHLVVTDATTLDAELRSHAGSVLLPLLDDADVLPPDPGGRIAGWTTDPTPTATAHAAQRVLARLPSPIGTRFQSTTSPRTSRFTRRTPKET